MILSDSTETREVEMELILKDWDDIFPDNCPDLDANYYFEDQRKSGLGLIVGENMPPTGNFDQAIIDFLTPILRNAENLKSFSPILRIAVYNRVCTCTINIKCLALIDRFCSEMNITVYPTTKKDKPDTHHKQLPKKPNRKLR